MTGDAQTLGSQDLVKECKLERDEAIQRLEVGICLLLFCPAPRWVWASLTPCATL